MILAISDMVPYYHIQTKERNYLMPITGISGFSLPINAALVLHDNEGETIFMVKIVKMSTEEGNGEVVLWMQPLDFYEGALLNTVTGAKKEFNPEFLKDSIMIGIYGEIPDRVPENRGEREWVPEPLTGNDYSFMDSSCRKICSESCPSCYDECYQGCTRWPRFNYSYEGYRRSLPSCCKNPPLQ